MAAEVISAIGLDITSNNGGVIGIREEHGSDAHFVISCLLSKFVQSEYSICLVALHHTFHHYHNVGMKLGYNLSALREKGVVRSIEPMKILAGDYDRYKDYDILNDTMINEIEKSVNEMEVSQKPILIIVDDLSHLLELDFSFKKILSLIKNIKTLIHSDLNSYALLNVHVSSEEELIISNIVQHSSNTQVCISPLKTGFSSNVSGKMEISEMNAKHKENLWNKQSVYHYKLHDRLVKVFAPGLAT